jgi:hypothetical protein
MDCGDLSPPFRSRLVGPHSEETDLAEHKSLVESGDKSPQPWMKTEISPWTKTEILLGQGQA